MTYSKIGSVEILLTSIQKEIGEMHASRYNHLKVLFMRLGDLSLGAYWVKRTVQKIESLSTILSDKTQTRITLEVHRILEKHVQNWFSLWNHEVYNVLDLISRAGYTPRPGLLQSCDWNWITSRSERFLPAAKRWYQVARCIWDLNVAEKIEAFFPQLAVSFVRIAPYNDPAFL